MTDQKKLGFVGFGAMARPMAARLKEAGFSIVIFDPADKGKDEVDGFKLLADAKAVAQEVGAGAIIVSVPNDAALAAAIQGPGGILEGAAKGLLLLDMSTVSPGASRKVGEASAQKGVRFVEIPVSGSTPEAESGQLVVLAGGEQADVDAAKSILDVIGRKTVHTGPVGSALVVKLVINGVMALGTVALAEGLAYGVKAGADRDMLIDTLRDLILVSEHHRRKLEMAKKGAYPAQFPTKLLLKDLGLLLAETAHHGVSMPTMAAAAQLYALTTNQHADEDYASAISVAENLAR